MGLSPESGPAKLDPIFNELLWLLSSVRRQQRDKGLPPSHTNCLPRQRGTGIASVGGRWGPLFKRKVFMTWPNVVLILGLCLFVGVPLIIAACYFFVARKVVDFIKEDSKRR